MLRNKVEVERIDDQGKGLTGAMSTTIWVLPSRNPGHLLVVEQDANLHVTEVSQALFDKRFKEREIEIGTWKPSKEK